MSLRFRLILAFLAVVSLLVVVGLISFRISRQIQTQVAHLKPGSILQLGHADLAEMSLEIEGFWHRKGSFVATSVERLPRPRRPKLRGEIQEIDHAGKTLTMYGVQVRVAAEAEFLDGADFEALQAGRRIEVSCRVDEDGRWIARKIKTKDVKESDKVKGTVTRVEADGVPPDTLEISGLLVTLALRKDSSNPRSQLTRIERATRMTLALQECQTAARELLDDRLPGSPGRQPGSQEAREGDRERSRSPADRLVRGLEDFEHYLGESRASTEVAIRAATTDGSDAPGTEEIALWLQPLSEKQLALEEHVSEFLRLAELGPQDARTFLHEVLDPMLQNELLPLIYAYRTDAEEALADEVQAISSRADTTARLVLGTSVVAVVLALLLAFLVWRSISRPILALNAAAVRIGQGHLDTRVEVHSTDELGVLAHAFNKMTTELAATTVSMTNLNSIIDSMAGALIVIDTRGVITNMNRAASTLLGYERGELLGQSFEIVCPKERVGDVVQPTEEGIVAIAEKVFRRKDGTSVPVSFSGAALRSAGGPLQGFVCVAQDLTERKGIEERLRRSLSEKELLLREVHHRVKNNLQVISSLLDLQSSYIEDPKALEKFSESQNRIRSMALIHEQLYTTNLAEIDFRAYLELLASHLLHSFGRPDSVQVRMQVEDLRLDIDQALACGLIVNELVTNALKHAFPAESAGEILISFREESGERVLSVADDGRGLREDFDPETSQSLGMSLVVTLVKQLRGRLWLNGDHGTEIRIAFPAESSERTAVRS
ncbi:MAG: histidine kinase dimerization/phosphoacceptor domain -containing protein [Candidatus Krumholzibacteriia bacterium]